MRQAWDEERCGPAAIIGSPCNASSCWKRSPSWSIATPEEICASGAAATALRGQHLHDLHWSLELLEQLGPLVTPTHLGHGAPRYHLAAEAEHVHLVCAECGRVTQVGPDAVQALVTALADHHGFETDVGHLTVFG